MDHVVPNSINVSVQTLLDRLDCFLGDIPDRYSYFSRSQIDDRNMNYFAFLTCLNRFLNALFREIDIFWEIPPNNEIKSLHKIVKMKL